MSTHVIAFTLASRFPGSCRRRAPGHVTSIVQWYGDAGPDRYASKMVSADGRGKRLVLALRPRRRWPWEADKTDSKGYGINLK